MKNINIIYLFILFTIISCNTKSKIVSGIDYNIVKIDSIKNVYLIYAEKKDASIKNSALIKIASIKTEKKCNKQKVIIANRIYRLNLQSLYPKNFVSNHYLGGITFNSIFIPFDKEYNIKKDLFVTDDIEGVCYLK